MAGIGVISQLVGFVAQKVLPQPNADSPNAFTNVRLGSYGEVAVNNYLPPRHALAQEGSLFSTCNVPGSGITIPEATTYANTAGCFFIQNLNNAGGPTAFVDYLKLVVAGTFTSMTGFRYAVWLDLATNLAIGTNHLSSATPQNVNRASSTQSKVNVLYQSSATASVNTGPSNLAALVANGSIGGIGIAGDELVINFGGDSANAYPGLTAVASVTPGRKVSISPALAIPPGWQAMIVPWMPGLAANPTADFELVHWER